MAGIALQVEQAVSDFVSAPVGRQRVAEQITGPPVKVSGIFPESGSVNLQLDQVITWDRPAMAQWYDVYFGADNPPLTKVSNNQAGRSYTPTLALDTTYYVRINAANSLGETAGDVLSFSTWASANILLDESNNPITDENGEYIETE